MNFHTFTIYILLFSSVSVFKLVLGTSVYTGSSYNDRESENGPGASSHQKKRLLNDDSTLTRSFHEEDQPEESDRVYDTPRYRKYQPSSGESGYSRRDSRMERQDGRENRDMSDFEGDERMNMQKREYFDAANNPKDSSIQVILDPRAKKAVAVVENSPSGQAMYDLSGWKNEKEDGSSFDDSYAQGNQEQVVNLVYPAERSEEHGSRKYAIENFDSSNSGKSPAEESRKRKRSTEIYKRSTADQKSEPEKRSATSDKRKTSESQVNELKSDTKQSDCPPHNSPNTAGIVSKDKKREAAPKWSQNQIDALTSSLMRAKDNNNEMDNLKSILSEMGLVDSQMTEKREVNSDGSEKETAASEKVEEQKRALDSSAATAAEDEDLNQDNLVLKRNDREVSTGNKFEVDVNEAPEEPLEKRDLEAEEENSEEEESNQNQESPALNSAPVMETAERSNNNNEEFQNTNAKEESDEAMVEDRSSAAARKKRQNTDKKEEDTAGKSNIQPMSENNSDNAKYTKRDAEDKKEKRKSHEDEEAYEHRIESQIQAKIDAIKEKVKREIMEERKRAKRNAKPYSRTRRETAMKSDDTQSAKVQNNQNSAKNIRKKRANNLPEKKMIYRAYQGEQDEENEEDGEFDDNAYDGRMYLEKRQADEDDFQYFSNPRKRDTAGYDQSYYSQQRSRRAFEDNDDSDDSAAFHGSGVANRKAALRNKSFNEREKRGNTFTAEEEEKSNENENMENSDSEYFGSLPQTYNGELTRYKRVKRDNPYK